MYVKKIDVELPLPTPQRSLLVEVFAHQARHFGGGVFAGDIETHLAQRKKQFADQTAAFPDGSGLDDLARALRKFT
jgi:hypothetical protein